METIWLYAILFISLVLLIVNREKRKLPPSPVAAFPVIGHLHLLKPPMHRTLQKLSEKSGPIFSLRFGGRLVVVVSSHAVVEECFTKNDVALANRPRTTIGKYIGYNYTVLTGAPYGEHWRNLRRLSTVEIFSSARLNVFQSIRHDESKLMLQKLYRKCKSDYARVEVRPIFSDLTLNNITRMVAGKRLFGQGEDDEEARQFQDLIKEIFTYGGISSPADFFPLLRWIDYQDFQKNLARVSGKMDAKLQGLIDEQRRNRGSNTMIDHLLGLQESQPEYYTDKIIKGIMMVMLLAGTDTSSVTIEWAMSALLNHPEKLDKARAELDHVVGDDRLVNESDLSKLPYIHNIVSETMRLFPATPLLVPHESSEDCKIAGYDVPKGTILLVNAWAVHRDPEIWDDPTSFRPERFEDGEVGTPKLIPFGMGRRSCPGSNLALRMVGLALGSLIQCFEWQRIGEELVDLSEGRGISMPKAIPLEARCRARDLLHKLLTT
ncbi:hypothetical protein F511_06435 [Dorcoceras hygrometricum]|uniref:(+)-piperitol/(+)-sesamin synthase n=1 Tax=Dorcoceras hygrometricum TaxID=472368 RepID=A0A2Z7AYV3_9LAMI|nr:hypothetical protein F511_06435 [Dorcoceras hygrometricum]